MTWNAADLLRSTIPRDAAVYAEHDGAHPTRIAAGPLVLDDAGVPMLPTVAAGLAWGELDADAPERWSQEMERDLRVEGFISQGEWDLWSRICRRGIVESVIDAPQRFLD